MGFDLFEEVGQGGLIGRVTGKHLVGNRKAFRCYNEGDDHLDAVAAFIAQVTKAVDVLRVLGRITFKVSAGKIIKEHLELGAKERAPALGKMTKECLFMLKELIVAFVEPVDLASAKSPPKRLPMAV